MLGHQILCLLPKITIMYYSFCSINKEGFSKFICFSIGSICYKCCKCCPHVYKIKLQALQLTKFDYRLANVLDEELQKLRCRVNYHALRFTKPIQVLGQKLVKKMRKMTSRFIAIHLRYAFVF